MLFRVLFIFLFFSLIPKSAWLQNREYNPGSVILEGIGINFSKTTSIENISDIGELMLSDVAFQFLIDSNNHFKIVLPLETASYFRIGRNMLYLEPGDSMRVFLDRNYPKSARFSGKGSAANSYLKDTPFPKAGSFINAGAGISGRFISNWKNILLCADEREKTLRSCKNISPVFKNYELGRIKSDIINSLYYMQLYYEDVIPKDSLKAYLAEYDRLAPPLLKKYAAGFYDASLLVLPVYRNILKVIRNYSTPNTKTAAIPVEDWLFAKNISDQLKHTSNTESVKTLAPAIDRIKNPKYKDVLQNVFEQKLLQFEGEQKAKIFRAIDADNMTVSIENYKGRVIYIDLWATWCGPCLAELPNFERLKQEYADNNDVAFISLSIDEDIKKWQSYITSMGLKGNQWNTNRLNLKDYFVEELPRYIIIDKDFKVIRQFAPKPSSTDTKKIIDSLVLKNNF
ncbi:TlpA family protein disulfide reductase [Niabella drilacis]|uniref:Thioredoxin-like n=1 Tax=Niabella drilacis (strain DSM 25811 / CCM 8410 / CCUG 62505 / LMG 26954 / E90) TaxID=1285928 RepID=A0A1G7AZE3_NIADE|nr:TlpA disulfide reductase family protein [Niabella drilacis]SDE19957.1 Thioredoxin-like [Niabella drilacis]